MKKIFVHHKVILYIVGRTPQPDLFFSESCFWRSGAVIRSFLPSNRSQLTTSIFRNIRPDTPSALSLTFVNQFLLADWPI